MVKSIDLPRETELESSKKNKIWIESLGGDL